MGDIYKLNPEDAKQWGSSEIQTDADLAEAIKGRPQAVVILIDVDKPELGKIVNYGCTDIQALGAISIARAVLEREIMDYKE